MGEFEGGGKGVRGCVGGLEGVLVVAVGGYGGVVGYEDYGAVAYFASEVFHEGLFCLGVVCIGIA